MLALSLLNCFLLSPGITFGEAAPASTTLTDAQLGNLRFEDLPRQNNLPILPFYSIESNVVIPDIHPPATAASQGRYRVGIQVGHWQSSELPVELASLRSSGGTNANGVSELEVGLNVSRLVAALLKQENIDVDILPATVPQNYQADVFLSIHSDWSAKATTTGFKLARSRYSLIPQTDDQLLDGLYQSYEAVTGFKREWGITSAMTGYYAFNHQKYHYTVNSSTPGAIIELGFLTNSTDRIYLSTQPEKVAEGLATGLTTFLKDKNSRQVTPSRHVPTLQVKGAPGETIPVLDQAGQPLAFVMAGQEFAYFQLEDNNTYSIWLPVLNRLGRIEQDQANITTG